VAEVVTLQYYIIWVLSGMLVILGLLWFFSGPPWDAGMVPQIRSWPCPF